MSGFVNKYSDLIGELNHLELLSKNYIMENWNKVDDWSSLSILMRNGNVENNENKKRQEWYSPVNVTIGTHTFTEKNPVNTISFILDSIDYDMSVTINGTEWWWISLDNVITIADFIEQKLNP